MGRMRWLPAVCLATLPWQGEAVAQSYPRGAVSIIGQTAPGSGPDVICRIVAERLSQRWGQPVVVINRQGAGGLIAAKAAAAAPADGSTLYMPTSTALVILPATSPKLEIDFVRDFVHIGLVGETPMAIAVSAKSGIDSLAGLIAEARKASDAMFYVANARGSVPHLAGEYLRKSAGITLTFVPQTGAPAALNEVLGGRIPIIIESTSALLGAVQDGSIRMLAVTSAKRLPNFPAIAAVSETLPDFALMAWLALLAPAGTPEAIARKINGDLHAVLANSQVRLKLEGLGVYPRHMSPAATAGFIRREQDLWRPLIEQIGLKQP